MAGCVFGFTLVRLDDDGIKVGTVVAPTKEAARVKLETWMDNKHPDYGIFDLKEIPPGDLTVIHSTE